MRRNSQMVNIRKKEREGSQQTGEMRERQKWKRSREEEEKFVSIYGIETMIRNELHIYTQNP